jgi:hypothetical protein
MNPWVWYLLVCGTENTFVRSITCKSGCCMEYPDVGLREGLEECRTVNRLLGIHIHVYWDPTCNFPGKYLSRCWARGRAMCAKQRAVR